jgi:hypothetical protein
MVAVIGAGCSNGSDETATAGSTGTANTVSSAGSGGTENVTDRDKGVRFAKCMRDNGISRFPDPDASGELTIDAVANGSSLDTSSPAWQEAIRACRDLQPPGFTGHTRSADQQEAALAFAQCMRDNGVADFPDPTAGGALIDTNKIPSAAGRGALEIPGFQAAMETCRELARDALGDR